MKSKTNRRIISIILFSVALILNVNKLLRHPGNSLLLLSIVGFAIVIGALLNDLTREYAQKKKDEASKQ